MKKETSTLANDFVCEQYVETKKGFVEPGKEMSFFDEVEFVKTFCYLGKWLNASDGSDSMKKS